MSFSASAFGDYAHSFSPPAAFKIDFALAFTPKGYQIGVWGNAPRHLPLEKKPARVHVPLNARGLKTGLQDLRWLREHDGICIDPDEAAR